MRCKSGKIIITGGNGNMWRMKVPVIHESQMQTKMGLGINGIVENERQQRQQQRKRTSSKKSNSFRSHMRTFCCVRLFVNEIKRCFYHSTLRLLCWQWQKSSAGSKHMLAEWGGEEGRVRTMRNFELFSEFFFLRSSLLCHMECLYLPWYIS